MLILDFGLAGLSHCDSDVLEDFFAKEEAVVTKGGGLAMSFSPGAVEGLAGRTRAVSLGPSIC